MVASLQYLTGCFFGDIVLVGANEPPDIVSSTTSEPILVVDQEIFHVFIAAIDDTDQVLTFLWTKGGEIIPDAQQIEDGSQIRLDRSEPGLDGKELRASVYDSEGATTTQSWILEVP
jgi:hypothetical protein